MPGSYMTLCVCTGAGGSGEVGETGGAQGGYGGQAEDGRGGRGRKAERGGPAPPGRHVDVRTVGRHRHMHDHVGLSVARAVDCIGTG